MVAAFRRDGRSARDHILLLLCARRACGAAELLPRAMARHRWRRPQGDRPLLLAQLFALGRRAVEQPQFVPGNRLQVGVPDNRVAVTELFPLPERRPTPRPDDGYE